MSAISLAEYDPAATRQQLHALIKVPGDIVTELGGRLTRLCPMATIRHDREGGIMQVVFPEAGERAAFLRLLVEVLDVYSGAPADSAPELLETRLVAVPDELAAPRLFSRHFRLVTDQTALVPGQPCLLLEHGTSFGSGRHPSTRLAMAALDRLAEGGSEFPARVLDVGCGSGILALACGVLGAAGVLGVDIDAPALAVAGANAAANGLAKRVRFSAQSLAELSGPYDLVVANVSGAVMSGLLGDFARLARPGGWLAVSGLQGRQLDEVVEVLAGLGFAVVELFSEGVWRAGLLRFGGSGSE